MQLFRWPAILFLALFQVACGDAWQDRRTAMSEAYRHSMLGPLRHWGVVIDQDGRPVAEAVLKGTVLKSSFFTGYKKSELKAITDDAGRFFLSDDDAREMWFGIAKPGYQTLSRWYPIGNIGYPRTETSVDHPEVIRLWRNVGRQPIVTHKGFKVGFRLAPSTTIAVDLVRGCPAEPGELADITLTFTCPAEDIAAIEQNATSVGTPRRLTVEESIVAPFRGMRSLVIAARDGAIHCHTGKIGQKADVNREREFQYARGVFTDLLSPEPVRFESRYPGSEWNHLYGFFSSRNGQVHGCFRLVFDTGQPHFSTMYAIRFEAVKVNPTGSPSLEME